MESYNLWSFVIICSLSIMFSKFIHVVKYVSTSFIFNYQQIFHYVDSSQFVYPFVNWWTFVFLLFGVYECGICLNVGVQAPLGHIAGSGFAGSHRALHLVLWGAHRSSHRHMFSSGPYPFCVTFISLFGNSQHQTGILVVVIPASSPLFELWDI